MTLPPEGVDRPAGIETEGWQAAFEAFRRTALAATEGPASPRPALAPWPGLHAVFAAARAHATGLPEAEARDFFTRHFAPQAVSVREAFFTGYYEPVVEGARERSAAFSAPLLARPDDLVGFAPYDPRPDWARDLAAARVGPDGTLSPYPSRRAIEAAAENGAFRPLVWLRDWVEVFLIHVQGSARVRLPDGRRLRLTYAGRNGRPYTSIGRILAKSGAIAPGAMSLDRLKAWLRDNGQAEGQPGRALMQRNASYIFFDATPDSDEAGPIGGAGVPLTALTSIAVDRTRWCYGLPFVIDAALPWAGPQPAPLRRATIAEDTGSAIVGPARVDLFLGSGPEAGRLAGGIRHKGSLTVLVPRDTGGAGP